MPVVGSAVSGRRELLLGAEAVLPSTSTGASFRSLQSASSSSVQTSSMMSMGSFSYSMTSPSSQSSSSWL